ncbi:hypothetical protein AAD018_017840 [Aestuariibius insulae]|uniref:hypothetical protein n=1 Tax=Aestuariibius insulae TaxID=2058287 RepID=UPI00345E0D9B
MSNPSRAIALYGTEEAVPAPRLLTAGKLTAELEAGNLRYIRWDGEEVLRAISFIVRDRDWGTYAPQISKLEIEEDGDVFQVSLRAEVQGKDETFIYEARIEGGSDGTLTFHGRGTTQTGFETNRTGFVILHPIDGIAGAPVTIEHTDKRIVEDRFPRIIDPIQPMMDLRALTHRTPGGLTVRVVMEGDTYEMEDQRNWTDASYKTYVRPLALPWPYRIGPDDVIDQTVTVIISGETSASGHSGTVELYPGSISGEMPSLGLGLRPENTKTTRGAAKALKELSPAYIVLHHDPRTGHDRASLEAMLDVANAIGAPPWLEAVIEATDDAGARAELQSLGETAAALGRPFDTVLVSPAPDLKCTLPGSVWPDTPDAAALYEAARSAFPGARIGGGMFSYFTELNRKPPPSGTLDLVSFTTSPMVHAGDDRSVLETREAHGAVAASVTKIADGTPWAVGPSAIGVRDNPYGEAAKDNPDNIRQAMNRNDPRQRGLLGAAWTLAYIADFAAGGASAIAIGGATGPFGVLSAGGDDPEPWYDGNGGFYPVYAVLRGLSRLKGAPRLGLNLSASGPLSAIAVQMADGIEIWAANMTPDPVEVRFPKPVEVAVLDASSFAEAATASDYLDHVTGRDPVMTLDSFAIARILMKG